MQTYESIEELKHLPENDDGYIIILVFLNGKEMNDPRVQAMFKRSRHIKSILFQKQSRKLRSFKESN